MAVDARELARRIDSFKAACREAGLKVTHQRLEIFREVARSAEHPDAMMVFRNVRKRLPEVSLDTVYRTLWLLKDLGMISVLGSAGDSARFDANIDRHHHFICVQCGMARDFQDSALDAIEAPAPAKRFGSALSTHIEVRGVCSRCLDKEKGKFLR